MATSSLAAFDRWVDCARLAASGSTVDVSLTARQVFNELRSDKKFSWMVGCLPRPAILGTSNAVADSPVDRAGACHVLSLADPTVSAFSFSKTVAALEVLGGGDAVVVHKHLALVVLAWIAGRCGSLGDFMTAFEPQIMELMSPRSGDHHHRSAAVVSGWVSQFILDLTFGSIGPRDDSTTTMMMTMDSDVVMDRPVMRTPIKGAATISSDADLVELVDPSSPWQSSDDHNICRAAPSQDDDDDDDGFESWQKSQPSTIDELCFLLEIFARVHRPMARRLASLAASKPPNNVDLSQSTSATVNKSTRFKVLLSIAEILDRGDIVAAVPMFALTQESSDLLGIPNAESLLLSPYTANTPPTRRVSHPCPVELAPIMTCTSGEQQPSTSGEHEQHNDNEDSDLRGLSHGGGGAEEEFSEAEEIVPTGTTTDAGTLGVTSRAKYEVESQKEKRDKQRSTASDSAVQHDPPPQPTCACCVCM